MYKITGKNANNRYQLTKSGQKNIGQSFMHNFISNATDPVPEKKGVYTVSAFHLS
jgi:hypothetical protein